MFSYKQGNQFSHELLFYLLLIANIVTPHELKEIFRQAADKTWTGLGSSKIE